MFKAHAEMRTYAWRRAERHTPKGEINKVARPLVVGCCKGISATSPIVLLTKPRVNSGSWSTDYLCFNISTPMSPKGKHQVFHLCAASSLTGTSGINAAAADTLKHTQTPSAHHFSVTGHIRCGCRCHHRGLFVFFILIRLFTDIKVDISC